jgi:hypothetical protein
VDGSRRWFSSGRNRHLAGLSHTQSQRHALDTFHTTDRAYIMFGNLPKDMKSGELRIDVTNRGRLPANDLNLAIYVARETFPEKMVFGIEKICVEHKYEISPGETERIAMPLHPWTDSDRQAIIDRKQAIFVGATLTYNDGFSSDLPISYEWCTQTSMTN